jgi:lipid-A-disaccharide synthase
MAKQLKIPVLYYISPQVWAWRLGRIKKIRRLVDHMAVILPFERSFYQKHGVSVSFVGHPLMDKIQPVLSRTKMDIFASDVNFPVIGLLPGSRDREIHRHLPDMLLAAQCLKQQFPEAGFCVSVAPGIDPDLVNEILSQHRNHLDVKTVSGGADRTFRRSDLVIAASGTVSLEAAISGVPMVIVYKVSPISFKLGKALVKVNFVCLVNLIAGKPLVPELLQDDANPKMIADTAARILNDPDEIARLKTDFKRLRQRLGGPGASQRVADIALKML